MSLRIAFTGTRKGLTPHQKDTLLHLFDELEYNFTIFHGGCSGADREMHELTADAPYMIVVYPGDAGQREWALRKREEGGDNIEVRNRKDYLRRNRDMVDACHLLIACPDTNEEQLRSGTWSTVRYAKKTHTPTLVIYPKE